MPIRGVARTKQLTAIIEKKTSDLAQQLCDVEADRTSLLSIPLLTTHARGFRDFIVKLSQIAGPNGPLEEIKPYFEDGSDKYYFSNCGDWWAYYFLERETAVEFLIAQQKLSQKELASRLKTSLRDYEGKNS